MCTIVASLGVVEDYSVCIAANRDEDHGRGFKSPSRWSLGDGRWLVAPRDVDEGGLWIGYNSEGLAVSITNLPGGGDGERSRGLLCRDILSESTLEDAVHCLEEGLMSDQYDRFNIGVFRDGEGFIGVHSGDLDVFEVNSGIHVLTNSPFDAGGAKSDSVMDRASRFREVDDWIDGYADLMTRHNPAICVHGEGRGTTSSSLIAVRNGEPDDSIYLFAYGAPCENDYFEAF